MGQLSEHLRQATPVVAERGEGVHLFGTDGRRYLDFTAGTGVTSTGHCHPRAVAAAQGGRVGVDEFLEYTYLASTVADARG
jgi:4-aminobutyrate aminotransferase